MADRKATWYLLGIAMGGDDSAPGFQVGWQYSDEYAAVVENINETHEPNAGGGGRGVFGSTLWTPRPAGGGGDGGHGGGNSSGGGGSGETLAWQISVDRDGNVSITNELKDALEGLVEVGVLFVFQWKNPKKAIGGKFDWIGRGDGHDVNRQNVVSKLEDPVGAVKRNNYWFQHGAKPGPYVPSQLLKKRTVSDGGIIVTVGPYWKAMDWAHIPNGE